MAFVYKFKVKLTESDSWRDIEVTSVSSIAKLAYAVLAAFSADASHLFCISFKGNTYGVFEETNDIQKLENIKLKDLNFTVGDVLSLEYDLGVGWQFDIELLSITEMQKGTGTHYPYITDGMGQGIAEEKVSGEKQETKVWNLDIENKFFKDGIEEIRAAYEDR